MPHEFKGLNADTWKQIGHNNFAKQEYMEAARAYVIAFELEPGISEAELYRYAQAILQRRDGLSASVCFDALLKKDPNNLQRCSDIGYLYYQNRQYKSAINYYNKAWELDKNNIRLLCTLAHVYELCEMPEDALSCYQDINNLPGADGYAWYYSARIYYYKFFKTDEALACIAKALTFFNSQTQDQRGIYQQIQRFQMEVLVSKAQYANNHRDINTALVCLNQLLDIKDQGCCTYKEKGKCISLRDTKNMCVTHKNVWKLKIALEKQIRTHADQLCCKGEDCLEKQKYPDALSYAQQALAFIPDYNDAMLLKSEAEKALGQSDSAEEEKQDSFLQVSPRSTYGQIHQLGLKLSGTKLADTSDDSIMMPPPPDELTSSASTQSSERSPSPITMEEDIEKGQFLSLV